jgi:uncharacterized protein (TIGR02117 family)
MFLSLFPKRIRRIFLFIVLAGTALGVVGWIWLFRIPFWLTVPDGFCFGRRLSAPVCRSVRPAEPVPTGDPMVPVYVVGHGWHTGLMLRMQDVKHGRWSADIDSTDIQAIEIGWGDEGFYRATDYTVGLAAEALLFPTPSVIHAVLLAKPAEENFPRSDISVFWTDQAGYQKLLDFIDGTFAKDSDGRLVNLGPGIYGRSTFFRARGSFHFPKSCNYWVASALREAGAPIWVSSAITAGNTMRQIHLFGDVIRDVPGMKLLPL